MLVSSPYISPNIFPSILCIPSQYVEAPGHQLLFFLGKFQQAIKCTKFRNLWSINHCFGLDLKSEPVLGSSSRLLDCILFHLYIFWFCRVSISITFFKFKSSLNIYFFSHFAIFRSVIFLPFHFESRHWLISFVVIRLSWSL